MGKGKGFQGTDVIPAQEFINQYRELEKEEKKFSKQLLESEVPTQLGIPIMHDVNFRKNFNEFANDVAYLLRHKMIYRSDGGRRARGIVRANGKLKLIHNAYLRLEYIEGQHIFLRIILVRIKDKIPPNRWMVGVDFKSELFQKDLVFEKDKVEGTPCHFLETLFALANFGAQTFSEKDRARINLLIRFAENIGCHKCYNLWYYNRYTNPNTSDKIRKQMSEHTNARLPLDGTSRCSPHYRWRVYPFKDIANASRISLNAGGNVSLGVAQDFRRHWNEIDQSLGDLYRNIGRGSGAVSAQKLFPWSASDAQKKVFGLAVPVFAHIHEYRQAGSRHLYSCFPVTK